MVCIGVGARAGAGVLVTMPCRGVEERHIVLYFDDRDFRSFREFLTYQEEAIGWGRGKDRSSTRVGGGGRVSVVVHGALTPH